MTRSLRIEFADAVCHVKARGNHGQPVFFVRVIFLGLTLSRSAAHFHCVPSFAAFALWREASGRMIQTGQKPAASRKGREGRKGEIGVRPADHAEGRRRNPELAGEQKPAKGA